MSVRVRADQKLEFPFEKIKDVKSIRKSIDRIGFNLTCLNLAHNQIFEISDFLPLTCPNLTILNLAHNKIYMVTNSIGDFKKLEILNLSFNRIEVLPKTFGNLVQLNHLDLSWNKLVDEALHENFFQLRTLERLYLCDNFLTKIGAEFGKFGNLKILAVRSV